MAELGWEYKGCWEDYLAGERGKNIKVVGSEIRNPE